MGKSLKRIVERNFEEHAKVASDCRKMEGQIADAAQRIVQCLAGGGKLLICGNGGSAADSNHLAAEFVNRFKKDRRALAAISLSANTSNITATGNDYSFDRVFSRQVEALGKKGDVLVAISTSAKSRNVLEAIKGAQKIGMGTILFTGDHDTEMVKKAGIAVKVPSKDTARIQELHLVAYHAICEIVESSKDVA